MEDYSCNRTIQGSLILVLALLLTSCSGTTGSGDGDYMSNGTITSADYRRCANPCCGGWFIEIEGESEARRFLELPPGSTLNLNPENLPIKVKLDWEVSDLQKEWDCASKVIAIQRIEER